jgi:EAL domain-containing protein (putative c-di-GMP-specific phosphodiesterase class I)
MREAVLDRLALKVDIHRALAEGEFVNHYQPVVSLANGQIIGAEALVRWEHPTQGLLAPGAFIDLAEESGVIIGIGTQVLRRACIDAAAWPDGPVGPLGIAVNLSVRQLQHEDLVREVADILVTSGLDPSRLTLEITESVLVADPEAAANVLSSLKALGVSIAIDDFGTGYSSLSYLHRFPVDCLKIDKSFVDPLSVPGADPALLQAILGLAHTLRLRVVAEGIEQPGQWTQLRAFGCELGQGYLFARPMPNEGITSYAQPSLVESV